MTVPRVLLACAVVLAFGCATTESAAPAAAKAAAPSRPTVPAEIEAPGERHARGPAVRARDAELPLSGDLGRGRGVEARWPPRRSSSGRAEPGGDIAGKHGAGPSWTLNDGSGAKGDAPNAKKAASPEAGAVAWLLIPAQSNGQAGELQGVTLVQRIGTHGGIAPAGGCDTASVGAETKVPYTATYVFYR